MRSASTGTAPDTIIDSCSAGNVAAMRGPLAEDPVLMPNVGSAPVRRAEHRYRREIAGRIEARRAVDHCRAGASEAVIGWTMIWRAVGATSRIATRGAEWFPFAAGGSVAAIRSCCQQRDATGVGLPRAARGCATEGVERIRVHPCGY